jgi:hypothetical protein
MNMKLSGRKKNGLTVLHSKDNTFCAVDVHPAELLGEPSSVDETISYTGIVVPQPELFNDFVQWKNTESLQHRMELLRRIQALANKEKSRDVFCVSVSTTKANGWTVGKIIIEDAVEHSLCWSLSHALSGILSRDF